MVRVKWHEHTLNLNDSDEKILNDLRKQTGLGIQTIYRQLLLRDEHTWTYTQNASVKNLKRDLEVAMAEIDSVKFQNNMLLDERANKMRELAIALAEKQRLEHDYKIVNEAFDRLQKQATDEINYAKKILAEKDLEISRLKSKTKPLHLSPLLPEPKQSPDEIITDLSDVPALAIEQKEKEEKEAVDVNERASGNG
jgi:hypothetical protein